MQVKNITQKHLKEKLPDLFNENKQILVISFTHTYFLENVKHITELLEDYFIPYILDQHNTCLIISVPSPEKAQKLKDIIDKTYLEDLTNHYLHEKIDNSELWLKMAQENHDNKPCFLGCEYTPYTTDFSLKDFIASFKDPRVVRRLKFYSENRSFEELNKMSEESFIEKLIDVTMYNSNFFDNKKDAHVFFKGIFDNMEVNKFINNEYSARLSTVTTVEQIMSAFHKLRKDEFDRETDIRLKSLSLLVDFLNTKEPPYKWDSNKNKQLLSLINENAIVTANDDSKFVDTGYINVDSLINSSFFHSSNDFIHGLGEKNMKPYHFFIEMKERVFAFLLCKKAYEINNKLHDFAKNIPDFEYQTTDLLNELENILK